MSSTSDAVMTQSAYTERLSSIVEDINNLSKISMEVGRLDKGGWLKLPDETAEGGFKRFGRRELRSEMKRVTDKVSELSRVYRQLARPRPKKKVQQFDADGNPIRRSGGFNLPIRVTQQLQQFFAGAKLGPVDPLDPQGPLLVDQIQLLTKRGITSPSLLTPLFSIYAIVNGLQDPDDHSILRADDRMRQYLGSTLTELKATVGDHLGKRGKNGRSPRMIPGFSPDAFRYAYLQKIVKCNKTGLTPEEKKALATEEEVRLRLPQEQQLVSDTLKQYKLLNQEDQKLRKTSRKRA